MFNSIKLIDIKNIAYEAGNAILQIYNQDFDFIEKEDNSPLTEADIKSNNIICTHLKQLYPHIPIISEENKQIPYEERQSWEYYWCIDPIDGTKEFINKNDEFTINIALIHKNSPILGVVYAPAIKEMYSAKKGEGVFKNDKNLPLKINQNIKDKITVVASKSHLSIETQKFIDRLKANTVEHIGKGSSLKLCMVASGEADIYPRLAPTMEWDTAAADAIVREAGKMCYQFENNQPLIYNKQSLLNPWFVVR